MIEFLESGKGVYAEGGDFGYSNRSTGIWPYFGAQYLADGNASGNVQELTGIPGTLGQGLSFSYPYGTGPDYWVDVLDGSPGTLFFRDQSGYGRAVCHSNGVYRTIASAVIFGALSRSNQGELMSRYVNYLLTGSAVSERPEQEELSAIQLQPNPVARDRTLRILIPAGADGQIAIINTAGQTLCRQPVRGKETVLNIEVPPGMYFVQLNSSSRTAIRPLVVTP